MENKDLLLNKRNDLTARMSNISVDFANDNSLDSSEHIDDAIQEYADNSDTLWKDIDDILKVLTIDFCIKKEIDLTPQQIDAMIDYDIYNYIRFDDVISQIDYELEKEKDEERYCVCAYCYDNQDNLCFSDYYKEFATYEEAKEHLQSLEVNDFDLDDNHYMYITIETGVGGSDNTLAYKYLNHYEYSSEIKEYKR